MLNKNIKRIGFACKYMHSDQSKTKKVLKDIEGPLNTKSTTVAWLNRQAVEIAEQRLWDIMEHNTAALTRLVEYVGTLPENLRMVRLGSDCLPMYTEPTWGYYWKLPDVERYLERAFAKVGETARRLDVRLSFHPGQFTVLASDNPAIVNKSIEEFEYHANMAKWMGYGQSFMDMKINVHISGRKGFQGIIDILPKLSTEARNTISIENDEMCWGLDESLKLKNHVALVLDIHHHWIRDEEYINVQDDRVQQVIESWRGQRPVIHYSYSRCEHLPDSPNRHKDMHSIRELLEQGCKKQKLRAHSDFYPNNAVNDWALSFLNEFDIMCESKSKNLASNQLYKYYKGSQNELFKPNVWSEERSTTCAEF